MRRHRLQPILRDFRSVRPLKNGHMRIIRHKLERIFRKSSSVGFSDALEINADVALSCAEEELR